MSTDRIYVQDAELPVDHWVRVQARLACGCFVRSNVKTAKPATAEYVLNHYGAHIALSAQHLNDHIHVCQQWLAEHGDELPEHHVDSLYALDFGNYDGQGKSRRQEEIDSMWVIGYLLGVLTLVALVIAVVAVLWWWL